jgi:hypothetical protein
MDWHARAPRNVKRITRARLLLATGLFILDLLCGVSLKAFAGERAAPALRPPEISDISAADLARTLNTQYQPVPKRHAWRYNRGDTSYLLDHVVGKRVKTVNGTRAYVLARGNSESFDCHTCGGLIGAFLFDSLDDFAKPLHLISGSPGIEVGFWGSTAALDIQFARFGPDDYFGWIIRSGSTFQGYTVVNALFLLPSGRDFVIAGNVPVSRDNAGACTAPADCYDLEFDLKIDDSASGAKLYPVILTKSGHDGIKIIKKDQYRIAFDSSKAKYVLPGSLKSVRYNITGGD